MQGDFLHKDFVHRSPIPNDIKGVTPPSGGL
jgi:hypothetical protein